MSDSGVVGNTQYTDTFEVDGVSAKVARTDGSFRYQSADTSSWLTTQLSIRLVSASTVAEAEAATLQEAVHAFVDGQQYTVYPTSGEDSGSGMRSGGGSSSGTVSGHRSLRSAERSLSAVPLGVEVCVWMW